MEKLYRPVMIRISSPKAVTDRDSGALCPVVEATVITENGQIWHRTMLAFGVTKNVVENDYQTNPDRFTKLQTT